MAMAEDSFPGHDEGTNKAPNAAFLDSPATHAPLQSGVSGGTTQKNDLGTTGTAEGGK